jgi:hypothetical protein
MRRYLYAMFLVVVCGATCRAEGIWTLLSPSTKAMELARFCDRHVGHPKCKKLEEFRAFCAANPMDTSRCHTSAGRLLLLCDSQDSAERAYCAGTLDGELMFGAAPQLGPPALVLSNPEPAIACVPVEVLRTPEQVRLLFVREAHSHPEVLHFPVKQLLFYALAKAFPCPSPLKDEPR